MLLKEILIAVLGAIFGLSTSTGLFALLISLGVITRIVAKIKNAGHILCYETAMTMGGVVGCILSIWLQLHLPIGGWFLCLVGLGTGIFVGCQAVALAEILNMFPIMFRRLKLTVGLSWILLAMALGKMCGSFVYFMNQS